VEEEREGQGEGKYGREELRKRGRTVSLGHGRHKDIGLHLCTKIPENDTKCTANGQLGTNMYISKQRDMECK
jgi:hypothetical protein